MIPTMNKQIAVITGVSSGIGLAFVEELILRDWFVIGCARRKSRIDALNVKYTPGNGHFTVVDVTDENSMKQWINSSVKHYGIPRLIIANAGISNANLIENVTVDIFDKTLKVNVGGAFLLFKHFMPHLKSQGKLNDKYKNRAKQSSNNNSIDSTSNITTNSDSNKNNYAIVGITSGAGRNGVGTLVAYSTSKWALEGLCASIASDFRKYDNLMCCSYDPGAVISEMTENFLDDTHITSQELARHAIPQFLEFVEKPTEYNGKQVTTSLMNDKRNRSGLRKAVLNWAHVANANVKSKL